MERKPKLSQETTSPYAKKLQRKPSNSGATGAAGRKLERKDTGKSLYNYDQHARQAGTGSKKASKDGGKPLVRKNSRQNLSERQTSFNSPRSNRSGSFSKGTSPIVGKQSGNNKGGNPKKPLLRNASTNSINIRPSRGNLSKSISLDEDPAIEEDVQRGFDIKAKSTPNIVPQETPSEVEKENAAFSEISPVSNYQKEEGRKGTARQEEQSSTNSATIVSSAGKDLDADSTREGYSTVCSIQIPCREPEKVSRVLQSTDEDNIETERSDSEPEESEDILSSSDEEMSTSSKSGNMMGRKGTKKGREKDDAVSLSSSKGSLSSRGSMTEAKLRDIQRAFAIFDKNSDGSITRQELSEVLQEADVSFTDQELDLFMAKLDKDGNGEIDYKEFCSMMADVVTAAMDMEKKMRAAFRTIDVNGDGRISQSELQDAMIKLGENITEADAAEIVASIDKNGDQHIDYEEFVTMMYLFNLI